MHVQALRFRKLSTTASGRPPAFLLLRVFSPEDSAYLGATCAFSTVSSCPRCILSRLFSEWARNWVSVAASLSIYVGTKPRYFLLFNSTIYHRLLYRFINHPVDQLEIQLSTIRISLSDPNSKTPPTRCCYVCEYVRTGHTSPSHHSFVGLR